MQDTVQMTKEIEYIQSLCGLQIRISEVSEYVDVDIQMERLTAKEIDKTAQRLFKALTGRQLVRETYQTDLQFEEAYESFLVLVNSFDGKMECLKETAAAL